MTAQNTTLEQELRELQAAISGLEGEAAVAFEAAEAEVARLRAEGREPLKDKDAFEQVDAAYKVCDGKRDEVAELRGRADRVMSILGTRKPARAAATRRDIVAAITGSPEYQRLVEAGVFTSGSGRIELPGTMVLDRAELQAAMQAHQPLFAATVDGAPLIAPDMRLYPPVPIPVRQVRVLDMVQVGSTDSDSVVYVEETVRTDVAAETAYGTDYSEATYTYVERTAPVRDIGQFVPAHRSQLADAGQLQALLEGRLGNGVERRLETQIVSGDGNAPNLEGILNKSGIGSYDRDTTNERRIEALHKGITWVRLNGYIEPDGIGLHPTDYEECIFEKDDNNNYLLGPAQAATSRTIWGFPVAVTPAFPLGTALVGAYKDGATLWLRAGVTVRASDSHSDFFTKRMVAILAELRAAFAAQQAKDFCEVTSL